ncbi:MAG: DNA gyrase subunit A [Bacteroidota bacterium]
MSNTREGKIVPIRIEEEIKTNFIDYAMSVIISRALPDVRDGLKPSQRRILYAMKELGLNPDAKHRKCAKICGDTSGSYHPHGEGVIYPTLVNLAQPWVKRYTLVEGQGNFGSVDGDPPAQMRYTEARFSRPTVDLLEDIDKETVDFAPNYDATTQEPTVFPGKFPNLIVNGATGIAVGMATSMPPHNLSEVIDGILAYIENTEIDIESLITHIKAPDFPTGGIIYGYQGVKDALLTGKGRIVMRGKATIEVNEQGRQQIIVTELPYMVNKALMIEKTAYLINNKKIEGIADLRDESGKDGMRVVYDLKKSAVASIVLNNLYQKTQLQAVFSVNNVALVKGKPQTLNIKELITAYVDHREEVITRKTQYEHKQATHKLHLLEGYIIAQENLDRVIELIKTAKTPHDAKLALEKAFALSEIQAKAILEMRLQRLTNLERNKIVKEHEATQKLLDYLNKVLAEKDLRMGLIKEDLAGLKKRYHDARKTDIEYDAAEFAIEDIIPNDPMVITVSHQGYVKKSPLNAYKSQHRGGVGSKGVTTKKGDFTTNIFVANAHDYLLIFTQAGKVFWKKVHKLPEGEKTTQGRAIQNLIAIQGDDKVITVLKVSQLKDPAYLKSHYIIFCTEKGIVKKTSLEAYARPRTKGIHAINIKEGDKLLDVRLTKGENHIILASRKGKAVRFPESEVRPMGRSSAGVKGMQVSEQEGDKVIGMISLDPSDNKSLLVLTEKGYGKRSSLGAYRITKRGAKGVKTLQVTSKNGPLVAMKAVTSKSEIMAVTSSGIALRTDVQALRSMGRITQGVRLVRVKTEDSIASVAIIQAAEEMVN